MRFFSLFVFGFLIFDSWLCFQYYEKTPIAVRIVNDESKTISCVLCNDLPSQTDQFARTVRMIDGSGSCETFHVDYLPIIPWGIDLNRAGVHLLTVIDGIGPATSEKIVRSRQNNGFFRDFEDFYLRTGISNNLRLEMNEWIYIGE